MHALYGSFVALSGLYTLVGVQMRIDADARRWWGTFLTSVYVCAFADAPLRYDVDYLFGSVQPYEQMTPLIGCIMTYLLCDLLYLPKEWDVRIHHIESLCGLGLAQLGYNIGVLNNCVLNEYSTIWLVLLHYTKPSTHPLVRALLAPASWALFAVTFVYYRVIPCTVILGTIGSHWARVAHDGPSTLHVLLFFVHCGLQFYWLAKIGTLVVRKIHRAVGVVASDEASSGRRDAESTKDA
jgi:hypothetical protein